MRSHQKNGPASRKSDIAVIGMASRFPGAKNYMAFWENIVAGKSSVTEVPEKRWDWKSYWGDPKTQTNKSNSKWGGFIEDVECFDADFFGMSAKEVELMDPQQRIMLELAWSCFEDAGVPPSSLSSAKVGVFLGVFNFDYKELQEKNTRFSIEAHHSTGTASAIIANRISYYFNLRGPSIPIDTACSSSLSAIHNAIHSINAGECVMALAGGINLLLTPTRHISFSKTGMLSPTGSCKTFDDAADGYVRGEGAGLLLLKPMDLALRDNNNIWGVIKGSAVNHGGKTYSLTYPNPEAQKEVIVSAQKNAGVTSDTIGYIEAHGTGTPKGDPMEFKGLIDAFNQNVPRGKRIKKNYCGLSSVKTNIGHLEAAAGVAGVIKVLLSLRNKRLPPLQNFTVPNHRMPIENSPFFLVEETTEWKAIKGGRNIDLPRRAGVSSFGFGGTNAHVVIEETPTRKKTKKSAVSYYVILLSAKTQESLKLKQIELLAWLEHNQLQTEVADVCKTLALGRDHFKERVAFVVDNVSTLIQKLRLSVKDEQPDGFLYKGIINLQKEQSNSLIGAEMLRKLEAGKFSKQVAYEKTKYLALSYVSGHTPELQKAWFGSHGRIINLPGYPFTRKHYWITVDSNIDTGHPVVGRSKHPLPGENISDFNNPRFRTKFSINDFFIRDHVIRQKKIFPAVAYLEMAIAAAHKLSKNGAAESVVRLKNIFWVHPLIINNDEHEIRITFSSKEANLFSFQIADEHNDSGERLSFSYGSVEVSHVKVQQHHRQLDFSEHKGYTVSKDECYQFLSTLGFNYGDAHQALETVSIQGERLIAKLKLPQSITESITDFLIHPSMADAALQAALLSSFREQTIAVPYLPYALDALELFQPFTTEMWALVESLDNPVSKSKSTRKFDISLFDNAGRLCTILKGITFKAWEENKTASVNAELSSLVLLTPTWKEKSMTVLITPPEYQHHIVFFCGYEYVNEEELKQKLPAVQINTLLTDSQDVITKYDLHADAVFSEIQSRMRSGVNGRILIQVITPATEGNVIFGLSGLLKTAHLENSNIVGQVIGMTDLSDVDDIIRKNAGMPDDHRIKYEDEKRFVATWRELEIPAKQDLPRWRDNGVYLITGGAGGLGLIMAKEIISKSQKVTIILTGRSEANASIKEEINALRMMGANVLYKTLDVTDEENVTQVITDIVSSFATLHGIIHSAGVLHDAFIPGKSKNDFRAVLAPKVFGTFYLDGATKDIPLDFFILFSSVVTSLGNAGQSDYATANGFMDEYAAYRNTLVKQSKRNGRTTVINWPLWKEGGMRLHEEMERAFTEQFQIDVMETSAGIAALRAIITSGVGQVMPVTGDKGKIRRKYLMQPSNELISASAGNRSLGLPEGDARPELIPEVEAIRYFKELLSATIKRAVDQIDEEAAMEQYGIDSIMVMQMTNRMEREFGTLPKTLFFEFQNIKDLTQYFLENHANKLREILDSQKVPVANEARAFQPNVSAELSAEHKQLLSKALVSERRENSNTSATLEIAIVGLAGRYPQADNLQQFWDNLAGGKDCITEIPEERWDYRQFFDPDNKGDGKSYSKWGGFINDVDKFDPLFFNITPLEAERMDPQERLFLQCVYETLEDAGYTRQSLAKRSTDQTNNIGVYVGVMYEEYQLFGAQEALHGRPVALWGLPSSIANRVSYYCNFQGPSMAIDTMCSSSLTAIHLACESIARGKCEAAIAGGVNVSVHPNKYLFLSQGRFASSKGRCESFGIGGDGYVPGEGVGAVLLKPLTKAIADNDHIYGVIKSTAVNHGGKTNGYTVPNPLAQASVIQEALNDAGVDPRAVSYIEAHGTGTSLGDPIEILGLSKAFKQFTPDTQFCAIGSAKSNIGHCESAAGIAGVTKVLLQLKHRQIVPSLHSATLNENIDFKNSPFIVQQALGEWKRPVITRDNRTTQYPLCAGISSFGAGGANAHIIIEEYMPAEPVATISSIVYKEPVPVVLSAMDAERLRLKVKQLLSIRTKNDFWSLTNENLIDMAYTLYVGREHMPLRLAMWVYTWDDLLTKLHDFLNGITNSDTLYFGEVMPSSLGVHKSSVGLSDDDVLKRWATGGKPDWHELYKGNTPLRRISLPTYPFRKDRYWIGEVNQRTEIKPIVNELSDKKIHPLLHRNISDFSGQRYSVTFTGEEYYIKDHVINNNKVLPAAVCIEMLREAVWQSVKGLGCKANDITLHQMRWMRPCIIDASPTTLIIELQAGENEEVRFEVFAEDRDQTEPKEVFCDGYAVIAFPSDTKQIAVMSIAELKQRCNLKDLRSGLVYDAFRSAGFSYGPSFNLLKHVSVGQDKLLAKAAITDTIRDDRFMLHPALLDCALHTTLCWNVSDLTKIDMYLPVAIKEITLLRATADVIWITVSPSDDSSDAGEGERILDISILNDKGEVCVLLKGVTLLKFTDKGISSMHKASAVGMLLTPVWEFKAKENLTTPVVFNKRVIIAHVPEEIVQKLTNAFPEAQIHIAEFNAGENFIDESLKVFETVHQILKTRDAGHVLCQVITLNDQLFSGISGLLKTAHKENPKFVGQVISVSEIHNVSDYIAEIISENSLYPIYSEVRYTSGAGREVLTWQAIDRNEINVYPWNDNSIYLITGGAGGLGLLMAQEISAKTTGSTLVLTGRSELNESIITKLSYLQTNGKVVYRQLDVANEQQVNDAIRTIRNEFGVINGIVHCAGVVHDNFIINKNVETWRETLAPKVDGVRYLDAATQNDNLDFFIFFSSISGAVGNIGQADYATANAFMDKFAVVRNTLAEKRLRSGLTMSVNWPLWREGGMQVNRETENLLFESMGIVPLSTKFAIEGLYNAMDNGYSQVMILEGSPDRVHQKIIIEGNVVLGNTVDESTVSSPDELLLPAINYFKSLLSSEVKLPFDKIKADVSFEDYGIDSVMVMKMTGKLEKVFGSLSKTLFFEYRNIKELATYFLHDHYSKVVTVLGITPAKDAVPQPSAEILARTNSQKDFSLSSSRLRKFLPTKTQTAGTKDEQSPDIAIVGVGGKYPQANDLNEFWQNLVEGKNSITEIPVERWDHKLYFDSDRNKAGKVYSKWGGFLSGVDEFDPLFFNISPREAEFMDPQERLFLQCAHETLEDAGYGRDLLSDETGLAGRIGVYVGVMYEEYQLYGVQESLNGRNVALSGNPASIANRVSYFYNFNGPSMVVDTMCSSSLTAIHLACQSIISGESRAAIAGGVNISIHPNKYLLLSQGKFISSKGQCESFGLGGDGYVPGEGVGAVFLKLLSQAIADGDHIYGVIKGTAVNHGGKTNGYTVPNPHAQAMVIKNAYHRSGIHPRSISYVEAHGTGTSLGDPIEIAGLKKAFQEFTHDNNFCAIGSVKSNIGHGESVAGMAALTKVLLQMKYKTLVPSLHSRELNPNIDFANSPFLVQQKVSDWKCPIVPLNGKLTECPRRAGISSFGAGGSNAHLIIEEYPGKAIELKDINAEEPVIIILSARNMDRLKALMIKVKEALSNGRFSNSDLYNIAYTLQVGRNTYDARLAMIVKSIDEITRKLNSFLEGQAYIEDFYSATVDRDNATLDTFSSDEELQAVIEKWFLRQKYGKLCDLWVKGLNVNWGGLYKKQRHTFSFSKVSLPTYPFTKERYWIPKIDTPAEKKMSATPVNTPTPIKMDDYYKVLTYEEAWVPKPLVKNPGYNNTQDAEIKRIVCFLSDINEQKKLLKQFQDISPSIQISFVSRNDLWSFGLDESDPQVYRQMILNLQSQLGSIDAFIYMGSFDDGHNISDFLPIVYFLQAIGLHSLASVKVLLVGNWNENEVPDEELTRCYLESWIGFTRSIQLAAPKIHLSVLFSQQTIKHDITSLGKILWDELIDSQDREVFYREDERLVKGIRKTNLAGGQTSIIRSGGTYLITGGLGGIGLLLAEFLLRNYNVSLILTGRSSLDKEKNAVLQRLRFMGSVQYLQANVADRQAMKDGLAKLDIKPRTINGVIHAAGIENEGTLLERTIDTFKSVVSSKIDGTIVLDELLKNEPLEFVCYFSSAAALLGDFGSCDYAVANRFQMAYANYRASLCDRGLRKGKTIAINWPLWKDGGMNLKDEDSTQMYLKSSGQRALETAEAMRIFEQLLVQPSNNQLVLVGNEPKVNEFLELLNVRSDDADRSATTSSFIQSQDEKQLITEQIEKDIADHVSRLLKIPVIQLNVKDNFADLGFDSVTLTQFASALSSDLGIPVVPAIFFSYSTIEKLAGYFANAYHGAIVSRYSIIKENTTAASDTSRQTQKETAGSDNQPMCTEPVAIIGMSGRFPESRNIDEMWRILSESRNVVKEIPKDRFDWKKYYGGEKITEGKTNCKWTGFIPGVKEFDPLFFEISPSEARLMDPRQRLLLQEGWKALEDAGFGKRHFEESKIGLFVGVEEGNYAELAKTEDSITSNHNAILAARLSYFLNLSGPNMAINTACSSGLVAAHQAFLSLQSRECDTAIAAGVNLMISPEPYILMSQAAMLSSDGTCHAFDKKANGLVPGEAVVVVVMKRLSKAIADGDPIYATIKGSSINYDGKTNGITAPSGLSQTELLKSVFNKYSIDPAQIEYIVTHGTGTRLGDPVEINALYDAFREFTQKQNFCALTSSKGNFGHTFAASGLVSLISLIQAFRNETIPPTLNCEIENDYINWQSSPFFINKAAKPWPAVKGQPRLGGVSAFGMSGTNAHMILESYDQPVNNSEMKHPYYLLPISAKTIEALQHRIRDMITFLEQTPVQTYGLDQICFTLGGGRLHFKFRSVVIARDRQDAIVKWKNILSGEKSNDVFSTVSNGFKPVHSVTKRLNDLLNVLPDYTNDDVKYRSVLGEIARYYNEGYDIDWCKLFPETIPNRLHLPTYPFAKDIYWIDQKGSSENTTEDAVKSCEALVKSWEHDMHLGKKISANELNKFITPDTLMIMPPELVERVYNLCFNAEEQNIPPVITPAQSESGVYNYHVKINDQTNGSTHDKTDMLDVVRAVIMQVLEVDNMEADRSFHEYGLDSIRAMKLATRLEKKLNVEVQPRCFIEFPTLTELVRFLQTEIQSVS